MRGNLGCLITAGAGLLSLLGTALGAHIYRWELFVWPAVTVVMALLAYSYSRRVQ